MKGATYVIAIRHLYSNDMEIVGPYRSLARASKIRDSYRDTQSVDYRDVEEYAVDIRLCEVSPNGV